MTEHDGLTFTPVFVKNLDAVFSCDRAHNILALVSLRLLLRFKLTRLRSQVRRSALSIHTSSKLVAATSSWRRLGVRKGKLRQMSLDRALGAPRKLCMSGLPPKAYIRRHDWHVRQGLRDVQGRFLRSIMHFWANQALTMALMAATLAPVDVSAQTIGQDNSGQALGTITPSNEAERLTGKERLSEKWKDNQRVDNCRVPIDKRGSKVRPDSCDRLPKN